MKYRYFRYFVLQLGFYFIFNLYNHHQSIAQTHMIAPPNVAPNTCKIIGKIVKVLPIVKSNQQPLQPCDKQACMAEVKVTKILGYGSGFPPFAQIHPTIVIKFAFTLGETKHLFPQLNRHMSGLKAGDIFEADVTSMESAESSGNQYIIYTYHKK